jgi:pilus assembly protein Flp/PilA
VLWKLYARVSGLFGREEGQGLVEYALILVLVAVAVIVVLTTMGNQIQGVFNRVNSALSGAP